MLAVARSSPSWGRGLKPKYIKYFESFDASSPSWGRGLKQRHYRVKVFIFSSSPSWGRGLKLLGSFSLPSLPHVVPLVGTWIETWIIFAA